MTAKACKKGSYYYPKLNKCITRTQLINKLEKDLTENTFGDDIQKIVGSKKGAWTSLYGDEQYDYRFKGKDFSVIANNRLGGNWFNPRFLELKGKEGHTRIEPTGAKISEKERERIRRKTASEFAKEGVPIDFFIDDFGTPHRKRK